MIEHTRDDAEDLYNQAIDTRDQNLKVLHDMNVAACRVIRGNLQEDDLLLPELDDVNGMPNEGSGKILARLTRPRSLMIHESQQSQPLRKIF